MQNIYSLTLKECAYAYIQCYKIHKWLYHLQVANSSRRLGSKSTYSEKKSANAETVDSWKMNIIDKTVQVRKA